MENLFAKDCIRTVSGRYVNVIAPAVEMIDIEDIAHGLAHQPRFGGQLPYFYSVAEHSLKCANCTIPDNKLEALLHDASEAYLMDIPSPLKKHLPEYKALEERMMKVIAEKFGMVYPLPYEIKEVDSIVLQWEWNCIMLTQVKKESFYPNKVKEMFLNVYEEYKRR